MRSELQNNIREAKVRKYHKERKPYDGIPVTLDFRGQK